MTPKWKLTAPRLEKLEAKFDGLELCHIPRRDNEEANSLARVGLTQDIPLGGVFLDELTKPLARWEVETQPLPKLSVLTVCKCNQALLWVLALMTT
jgi:hypothetical protein